MLSDDSKQQRDMAADSFLAALMGNYVNSDPGTENLATVRGLLNFCRRWTLGEVETEELNNPCFEMALRLREGALQMETSLRDNPEMSPETMGPIARTAQAYLAIAEVLEELPDLAREGQQEDFADNLDLFEQERQAVLEAQEQIELQLSGKVPLCPRCGSADLDSLCQACGLTRLYPDPKALSQDEDSSQTAGVYGDIYLAFRDAVSGEGTLEAVWTSLDQLEAHLDGLKEYLQELLEGLRQEPQAESATIEALLSSVGADISAAQAGLTRMREAQTSLRAYDLQRGWEDIYHASRGIEVSASKVRRALREDELD